MLLRGVGVFIALPFALLLGENLIDRQAMLWGALLGLSTYGLASILAIVGLRYSNNLLHILLWFLTPVLAVAWIMCFLDERLTDLHVIAFMPILLANIFTNVRRIRRASFFVMTIFSLVSGVFIYLVDPISNAESLTALGVVFSAYAIIVSFILQRKLADIRELGMELAEALEKTRGTGVSEVQTLDLLENCTDRPEPLPKALAGDLRKSAHRIRVERATSFVSAEAIVLSILTSVILAIALVFRPDGFVADITSFAIAVTTVFLTIFSIECADTGFQWRIARAAILPEPGGVDRVRDSIFLSIAGTAIMVALVAALLVDKWLFDVLDTILR